MRATIGVMLGAALLIAALAVPARGQEQVATTLAQAVNLALTRNPQIAAAEADLRATEASLKIVRAGLAPTVSLSASPSITYSGGSTTTGAQVSAGVSYLLFDGGLRQAQILQAEAQVEAARQTLAVSRAAVALAAVQGYLAVVVDEQLIAVREQAVAQARTQSAAAQARVTAGTAPQADVIQAQSQLAGAEFELVSARAALERDRLNLQSTLGLDASAPVGVTSPGAPPALAVTPAEALQRALQRPESLKADADARASEAALAAAMIQGGVTVSLDGRYVLVTAGSSGASQPGSASIGIGISLPLYDGGEARGQVEQARARLDATRARSESTKLLMRQEALQALQQVAAGSARVEAAQRAAEAAREALRVAEGRYRAGVGTVLEVATVQTGVITAQVSLVQVEADRWIAAATLRRALALSILP